MALTLLIFTLLIALIQAQKIVYNTEGDVNIVVLVKSCNATSGPGDSQDNEILTQTIWTTHRLNVLKTLGNLTVGLRIQEVCLESDYYKSVFEVFDREEFLLGLYGSAKKFDAKVLKFCELLNIGPVEVLRNNREEIYRTVATLLDAVRWDNVTVLAGSEVVLDEFYEIIDHQVSCITSCIVYRGATFPKEFNGSPVVFFGNKNSIEQFTAQVKEQQIQLIVAPLDGSTPNDLPDSSFIILPPHHGDLTPIKLSNIHPGPLLLDIARPFLHKIESLKDFITLNCNETSYKLNCLRNKSPKFLAPTPQISNSEILNKLQLEPLREFFVYEIYQADHHTLDNLTEFELVKTFTYNLIDNNLTTINELFELNTTQRTGVCKRKSHIHLLESFYIKSDSSVFIFLALSLLGVSFCVAILIFFVVSICRRTILEGNPLGTIVLLLAVMLLFLSVLPFSLQETRLSKDYISLAKGLSTTLSYAMVLSLLLSRCILLATASKDIGFMSHIAGPVQSFLCLFIFGVQAALSLQLIHRRSEIFHNYCFIFFMSYNIMLLLLLLCLSPLIYQSQRNYREGKYFAWTISLMTCLWCIWLPCYAILIEWREIILCLGLVGTGGIFLGTIFIPRTYLMTISAAREKLRSNLPSLATATSNIDIYRVNNQPVYDCVNSVAIARAGGVLEQPPDLYSCPALPEDADFHFRCDSLMGADKVTRF